MPSRITATHGVCNRLSWRMDQYSSASDPDIVVWGDGRNDQFVPSRPTWCGKKVWLTVDVSGKSSIPDVAASFEISYEKILESHALTGPRLQNQHVGFPTGRKIQNPLVRLIPQSSLRGNKKNIPTNPSSRCPIEARKGPQGAGPTSCCCSNPSSSLAEDSAAL